MIRLSQAQLDDIHTQAEAAYPYECCGLLAGRKEPDGSISVTRVVPSPNILKDEALGGGKDRFEVDPQVRFDLMRAVADTDEDIVGHYHSHPDHPAEPSKTDIDMAFEPEMVWVITEVNNRKTVRSTAWKLDRNARAVHRFELAIYDKTQA